LTKTWTLGRETWTSKRNMLLDAKKTLGCQF
jgi:hypothetical protein